MQSPLVRVLFLAGLTLLFVVPLVLVQILVGEREARRRSALIEMGASWGRPQTLVGLSSPFRSGRRSQKPTERRGRASGRRFFYRPN